MFHRLFIASYFCSVKIPYGEMAGMEAPIYKTMMEKSYGSVAGRLLMEPSRPESISTMLICMCGTITMFFMLMSVSL